MTNDPSDIPAIYLVKAYNSLRRDGWGEMEDALAHPTRGVAIRAVARNMQRRAENPEPPKPPQFEVKTRAATTSRTLEDRRQSQRGIDLKRRASGEREDD